MDYKFKSESLKKKDHINISITTDVKTYHFPMEKSQARLFMQTIDNSIL